MNIDIIIPYVNPNDREWQQKYYQYINDSNEQYKENRFRDTSFLKYVLRSIGKYMQWVNNVFLIVQSESQIPEWINTETVKTVLHKDFIPKEYLPVFNCNTIEMFMHKIPGLSDYFIYFNDDTIINQPCYKHDFFFGNKCNVYPIKTKFNTPVLGSWYNCLLNDKTEVDNVLNIQNNDDFIYKFSHTATPLFKPLCDECYNKLEGEIKKRITRFRELNNFNQHLFAYYIYVTGNSNKISVPVGYVNINKYISNITELNIKTICLNDIVTKDINIINVNRKLYLNDLENKFSTISKYENTNIINYE